MSDVLARKKAADRRADTEDLDDLAPNGESVAEALQTVENEEDEHDEGAMACP
jgi:hypothetical protein